MPHGTRLDGRGDELSLDSCHSPGPLLLVPQGQMVGLLSGEQSTPTGIFISQEPTAWANHPWAGRPCM